MRKKNQIKKSIALLLLFFVLVESVSAANFQGVLWQFEIMLVSIATVLLVLAFFKPDVPVVGILSAIFWIFSAIGSNKVLIYLEDGQRITFMGEWQLTYLFGFISVLMIIFSLYNYLTFAQREIGRASPERGDITRTF